ncbi:organic solute transporter Ostalpha-domain-containing protein [Mycena rosella]|uniref:Organic solute transporter Ostalpha-domain-containing protein n=1 Tax=Mycena rosella TaxID=1033263 RepID=A0AAD7GIC4_MYCRO|nr:organic solute transporter Ostalpha-domain-containing protein [Mycena rosella]
MVFLGGAGSKLPTPVLTVAGLSTLVAVVVSGLSIHLQFRNYRKPALQRMVVRIMIMVPIYAVSSLISLFSLEAAFFIDAIRDIYEAFVIYCFFVLLLSYLGGERSLLIMLHGRPPKDPVFPVSLFKREIDVSDPYMFLFLKRGILQYVQVKPVLAVVTLILKACGKYNEGSFSSNSGYLYVSVVYNTSICLSLYCLAVFWMCVNDDLKPFRPVPKFLCVKGILFFSFWQAIFISILVSSGVITHLGPYTRDEDQDLIALALTDTLICLEMPFFAFAHAYAFSHTDFIDATTMYVARMPMYYAVRDAFGLRDVVADSRATLRGEGMDYRAFEPSEGYMHQGEGRERRIRAGLRYSQGGRRKYWLPQPAERTHVAGGAGGRVRGALDGALGRDGLDDVHAPLMAAQEEDVVHLAPDLAAAARGPQEPNIWEGLDGDGGGADDGYDLPFGAPDELGDEALFGASRQLVFGDYNYPCIDVSSEAARTQIWDEEERVLRDERSAWFSPIRGALGKQVLEARERPRWEGYGSVGSTVSRPPPPPGAPAIVQGDRLVDHEDNAGPPPAEGVDVRLKWTRSQQPQPPSRTNSGASQSKAHLPARHMQQQQQQRGSAPSSPGAGPSSLDRHTPTHTPTPSASRPSSVLPPDAVDLVVEDPAAAEEGRVQERRKGEPAIGGSALRKVYRRGFVAADAEGGVVEGEVEVVEPPEGARSPPGRVERGEEVLGAIESDDEEEESEGGGEEGGAVLPEQEPEGILARAGTPPAHARFVPSDSEDNPWA